MRILVTRPEPDASATGQRLEALGHQVTTEPMLQVEFLPIDPVAFTGAQAVIATSRNALRALASSGACDAAKPSSLPKSLMPDAASVLIGPAEMPLARMPF